MNYKIEITVDVIIHATEDRSKIFQSFEEVLNLKKEAFAVSNTIGHFDNPITILNAKIDKKRTSAFMKNLLKRLSTKQINQIIGEIEERTSNSKFHMRLNKQQIINKNLVLDERDSVKIKIHTPIYNKKDTIKIFTEILETAY